MNIDLKKLIAIRECKPFLFLILGWTFIIMFNSCAMFKSGKTATADNPGDPQVSEKQDLAVDKKLSKTRKASRVTVFKEVEPAPDSNVSQETEASPEKGVAVASLTPSPGKKAPENKFESLTFSSSPRLFLDDMDQASMKKVIANQLDILERIPGFRTYRLGDTNVTAAKLKETLEEFVELLDKNLPAEEFSREVRENFVIHEAGRWKNNKALLTGYYTPVIQASRVKTGEYIYPLYDMPEDFPGNRMNFQRVSASFRDFGFHMIPQKTLTRGEIDGENRLRNRNLEIAWLKDDLERYFLHIQGSGILEYEDGTLEGVQYVGSNRFPYESVGQLLIRDRMITESQGSMQGIKKYFKENPRQVSKYLYQNKRYIFFRRTDFSPRGSGGGEVVAGRSIATDKSLYPAGALAFIVAQKPVLGHDSKIVDWEMFSRFVLDQDTGSAIKGPGRADLYFGTGEEAGEAAGHYMQRGKLFYLVKK